MTDIVPIPLRRTLISGIEIETVDARDIHSFLEVGKDFTTWIKDRIEQYGFEGGADYVRVFAETGENSPQENCSPKSGSKQRGGHNRVDYFVTLDMAKELAMVERTEKGKIARRHFLECERKLKELGRQFAVSPTVTPEVIRGIMRGLLTEVVPPMIEAKLAEDPRIAVGEYEPALKVLVDRGVPSKGRRGFANRVSYRLRAYCAARGIICRRDRWRGVWVYPVAAVQEWLKQEGGAMIADHCAQFSKQPIFLFPNRPSRPSRGDDGHVA